LQTINDSTEAGLHSVFCAGEPAGVTGVQEKDEFLLTNVTLEPMIFTVWFQQMSLWRRDHLE